LTLKIVPYVAPEPVDIADWCAKHHLDVSVVQESGGLWTAHVASYGLLKGVAKSALEAVCELATMLEGEQIGTVTAPDELIVGEWRGILVGSG
jgi:hypothetical protein